MNVAVISLGRIGFVAGTILAIASRIFHVDEDPKEHELLEALPGINCGTCGFSSVRSLCESHCRWEGDSVEAYNFEFDS